MSHPAPAPHGRKPDTTPLPFVLVENDPAQWYSALDEPPANHVAAILKEAQTAEREMCDEATGSPRRRTRRNDAAVARDALLRARELIDLDLQRHPPSVVPGTDIVREALRLAGQIAHLAPRMSAVQTLRLAEELALVATWVDAAQRVLVPLLPAPTTPALPEPLAARRIARVPRPRRLLTAGAR